MEFGSIASYCGKKDRDFFVKSVPRLHKRTCYARLSYCGIASIFIAINRSNGPCNSLKTLIIAELDLT